MHSPESRRRFWMRHLRSIVASTNCGTGRLAAFSQDTMTTRRPGAFRQQVIHLHIAGSGRFDARDGDWIAEILLKTHETNDVREIDFIGLVFKPVLACSLADLARPRRK